MSDVFEFSSRQVACPVVLVAPVSFARVRGKLAAEVRNWLDANAFAGKPGQLCGVPNPDGSIDKFYCGVSNLNDPFAVGDLPTRLPEGTYALEGAGVRSKLESLALGWGFGSYQFDRYRTSAPVRAAARLKLPKSVNHMRVTELVAATCLVRDMINTPAEDMMPQHIGAVVEKLAQTHNAEFTEIVGDELLMEDYPCIHTVGRASVHPPRLLDLVWGDPSHPKVTLVGKGISFDSGGLDIKPAAGMRSMKKDMGGAAHTIGLAQIIMAMDLPVRLRLLVACAENAISGDAFRPGDVVRTRSGQTVEIDNTDAEGRLVLCDALTEACTDKPELLIDFATLTGAARVAVGTEIAAYFCNNNELARNLFDAGELVRDPTWQLPLHRGYASQLKSHVADMQNCGTSPLGGATTAALYLEKFVSNGIDWLHFDIMAWNNRVRRGRPIGGEAMGLRAVYEYLDGKYGV